MFRVKSLLNRHGHHYYFIVLEVSMDQFVEYLRQEITGGRNNDLLLWG
jgi:hypothetical protein